MAEENNRNKGYSAQEKNSFACSLCPYSNDLRHVMICHTEAVHQKVTGAHECVHMETCHYPKFKCPVCDRSFHAKSSLRRHQDNVHCENKKFKCNLCEYATSYEANLKRHMEQKKHKSLSSQLTDKFVKRKKKSTKKNLSKRPKHDAEKDFVETCSVIKLDSLSHNKKKRLQDVEKQPKGFSKKTKVLKESKGQESAGAQIKSVVKNVKSRSLRKKNATDSKKFVDKKMRKDATSSASSVARVDQRFSSLSRPVGTTPSHWLNSIHEEARLLRAKISLATTIHAALSLLERLLELAASITIEIRGSVEVEFRSQAIECFEYVWGTSKMAVSSCEEMDGSIENNSFLKAVEYAYQTLPVFIRWEKSKHLEMVEHVILLTINTVKNCKPSSIGLVVKKEPLFSFQNTVNTRSHSSNSTGTAEEMTNQKWVPFVAKKIAKKEIVPLVQVPEDKNNPMTLEFCRMANIATWQNTKERNASGFKDDSGAYHPMYRYGIRKMLSLYCPAHVTHLKCCGEVFSLFGLKAHVVCRHEAGRPNRTEPSISPL